MPDPLVEASEAAILLGCSVRTIRRNEERWALVPYRRNKTRVAYLLSGIERLRAEWRSTPAQPPKAA